MKDFVFTIGEPSETGFRDVKAEGVKPCPLCGAKHEGYHTRNVWIYAVKRGSYYTAGVECMSCKLNIERCTEDLQGGSLEESIGLVLDAWNKRQQNGGEG